MKTNDKIKNWIWWQALHANDATYVGSYFNINNDPENTDGTLFKSSFDGIGPFERNKIAKRKKIGFNNR